MLDEDWDTDGFMTDSCRHIAFMQSKEDPKLPRNYKEAMMEPELWILAMDEEMAKMKERGIFQMVPLPKGARLLPTMWLYAHKYDSDRNIIRRKARFLVLGSISERPQ